MLTLPERQIYARLGYNFHKTEVDPGQRRDIEATIEEAFSLCGPRGLWTEVGIASRDSGSVTLAEDIRLSSVSLSSMLSGCRSVLLMAATVGEEIITAIAEKISREETAAALIYDAVGSETADETLDWINRYLRQEYIRKGAALTKRRFSPGYADMGLENQKIIYDILGMDRIGVSITERYVLVPEKSVIGIAGVM